MLNTFLHTFEYDYFFKWNASLSKRNKFFFLFDNFLHDTRDYENPNE